MYYKLQFRIRNQGQLGRFQVYVNELKFNCFNFIAPSRNKILKIKENKLVILMSNVGT